MYMICNNKQYYNTYKITFVTQINALQMEKYNYIINGILIIIRAPMEAYYIKCTYDTISFEVSLLSFLKNATNQWHRNVITGLLGYVLVSYSIPTQLQILFKL